MKGSFSGRSSCPGLGGRSRKPQSELETGRVVDHFDPRIMEMGDGCDKAQPQAVAGCVAALLQPIEALEPLVVLPGRDSRAIVADRNYRAAVHLLARDDDTAAGAAM